MTSVSDGDCNTADGKEKSKKRGDERVQTKKRGSEGRNDAVKTKKKKKKKTWRQQHLSKVFSFFGIHNHVTLQLPKYLDRSESGPDFIRFFIFISIFIFIFISSSSFIFHIDYY